MSYSEIRVAYEVSVQLKTDVCIGSTHIIQPGLFVREMRL